MKRYNPGCRRSEAEMFEEPNGEWVKHDIAEALYVALLNILWLRVDENGSEEAWTKAWVKGVDAIRKAHDEEAGEGEGE